MLDTGSVIEATIYRIEPYGIYLQASGDTILVTAEKLSWLPSPDMVAQYKVGQAIQLMIERFNDADQVYAGNVKLLSPERNPYQEFALLPACQVIRGRVKAVLGNRVLVELNRYCDGHLPLNEETEKLSEGADVDVQITSLEINYSHIALRLVKPIAE